MIPTKERTPRVSWLNPTISNFFDTDKWPIEDFFTKRDLFPSINLIENTDNFILEIAAPGFFKKDFTITIDDGLLNISAEKQDKKDNAFIHQEFSCKSFTRSILLPENVMQNTDVKAHYEKGILKLCLLKKELEDSSKHKIIEVI